MKKKLHLKMSELAKKSGVPASTIHFYAREGLLPPPVKMGKTMAYYSDAHLKRLAFIRKLTAKEKKSIKEVKEIVAENYKERDLEGAAADEMTTNRREAIIQSAIKLFRKKGLNNTSVNDLVAHAGAGKGTFYANFKNKEELFFECADRILYEMTEEIFQKAEDEKDPRLTMKRRLHAFFATYPKWIDMMNLVRGASVGNNPEFSRKLVQVMKQVTEPIVQGLEAEKKEGRIPQETDSRITAFISMGIAEYAAYLQYHGDFPEDYVYNYVVGLLELTDYSLVLNLKTLPIRGRR